MQNNRIWWKVNSDQFTFEGDLLFFQHPPTVIIQSKQKEVLWEKKKSVRHLSNGVYKNGKYAVQIIKKWWVARIIFCAHWKIKRFEIFLRGCGVQSDQNNQRRVIWNEKWVKQHPETWKRFGGLKKSTGWNKKLISLRLNICRRYNKEMVW